jgi:hypothetical protein
MCPDSAGKAGTRLRAKVCVVSMRGIQPPAAAQARGAGGRCCAKGSSTTVSRTHTPWSVAHALTCATMRREGSQARNFERFDGYRRHSIYEGNCGPGGAEGKAQCVIILPCRCSGAAQGKDHEQ